MSAPMFSACACEHDCDGDSIEPSEADAAAAAEAAWRVEQRDVKRAPIVADCREWCE